jgi:putative oxidoreductase
VRGLLSNRYLLFASRFLLGLVFLVAAVPKIAQPGTFAASVEAYEILPVAAVNLVAILVPWMELLCAIFLIGDARVRPSAALLGMMLLVFIVAISTAVVRGLNINCGCYGGTGTPVGWGKVLEDVALLIPAWLLARRGPGPGPAEGTGA